MATFARNDHPSESTEFHALLSDHDRHESVELQPISCQQSADHQPNDDYDGLHQQQQQHRPGNGMSPADMAEIRAITKSCCVAKHDKTSSERKSPPGNEFRTLGWLTCPVTSAMEDDVLPAMTVYAEPELTNELELVVHSNGEGEPQVGGHRYVSLRSQGSGRPSVATFDDIRIKRAGLYVIEVRSAADPEISLLADLPIRIEPKIETATSVMDGNLPEEYGLGTAKLW